jgi:hypothetical protein
MPKVIIPERDFGSGELSFPDALWANIKCHIPKSLPAKDEALLRSTVADACAWFCIEQKRLAVGKEGAALMRRPRDERPALLKAFANHLRAAASNWKRIKKHHLETVHAYQGAPYHDPYLGDDVCQYDALEGMALNAEHGFARLRKLGEAETIAKPFPAFVRKVGQCCSKAGLDPTVTNRMYDKGVPGKPTWFHKFMAALCMDLLGYGNLLKKRDLKAFFAAVTKAMAGYKNQDKVRKQITG